MADPKPNAQNQTAPNNLLSEGVHYVSRASVINGNLVEQAGIVISNRDARGRYLLTVFQPGEAPKEVTATYSDVPADGTFHMRLTRHEELGQKSKRFLF